MGEPSELSIYVLPILHLIPLINVEIIDITLNSLTMQLYLLPGDHALSHTLRRSGLVGEGPGISLQRSCSSVDNEFHYVVTSVHFDVRNCTQCYAAAHVTT